ncbi:MAG: M20/M25/M40 family metallo-hydrolase [Gemmatimonadetes bacterium]|nr:M20/M25/M40 family metallo-hydrolase [Gemmatimonadota bacterium]
MTRPILAVALGLAVAASAQAQTFDQKAVGRAVLKELIESNTTPSVGNTTKAAELVAARFRAAGVAASEIAIVGPDELHKNLVIRIRGADRTRKAILLLAHLDVVEAERKDWNMDPFKFNEVEGFYYGRGTQDIKGGATTLITSLLRMRAEKFTPARDLILALTAGEEGGMPNGVEWLLANRKDLVDAEYCINVDGGGVDSEKGKPVVMNLQAAEKVYFDAKLTVTNKGGHSSLPRPDNAINALARALVKIEGYTFPVEFNEITRAYMERSAPLRGGALGADLKAASSVPADPAAIKRLSEDPWFNAQMRTTCIATLLAGGHAPNALPQSASANVNCRRLPGLKSDSLVRLLTRIIGDTNVVITIDQDSPQSPPSPLRPDVESAVRAATEAIAPNLPLVPNMETGATDGLYFRNAGIPVYGLSGIAIDTDDVRMHGRDERVNIVAFERAQEFMYRLLRTITTPVTP